MEEIFSYSMRRRCLVPVFLHVYQHVDIVDSNMDLSLTRVTTESSDYTNTLLGK